MTNTKLHPKNRFAGHDHGTKGTKRERGWDSLFEVRRRVQAARAAAAWSQLGVGVAPDLTDLGLPEDDEGQPDWDDLYFERYEDRPDFSWLHAKEGYYDIDTHGLAAAIQNSDYEVADEIRDILEQREADQYPGLADLGLDPTPRLRRSTVIDELDPHEAFDYQDYVGIAVVK